MKPFGGIPLVLIFVNGCMILNPVAVVEITQCKIYDVKILNTDSIKNDFKSQTFIKNASMQQKD